ncbi:hypothetical protein BVY03_03170 [bacterium K02(2017)]|nr:hypothetical protein BVY03_03170 [bacterium K02(2017)]
MSSISKNHVSIRNYKTTPLKKGLLEDIIESGLRSSSAGNMQSWTVIATTDTALKEKLYKAHYEQPMILQVPVVLTFCADFYRMRRWLKIRDAKGSFDDLTGFLTGSVDAVIAAQSIALAAEEHGLGICYMGTTLWAAKEISHILNVPKNVVPVTSLVMGYPNESPELRDRLPLNCLLHHDKYHDYSDEDIKKIYKEREVNGWKRYMSDPERVKMAKKFDVNNLAQYYSSDAKYGKKLHRETSLEMLEVLKNQNFFNHND